MKLENPLSQISPRTFPATELLGDLRGSPFLGVLEYMHFRASLVLAESSPRGKEWHCLMGLRRFLSSSGPCLFLQSFQVQFPSHQSSSSPAATCESKSKGSGSVFWSPWTLNMHGAQRNKTARKLQRYQIKIPLNKNCYFSLHALNHFRKTAQVWGSTCHLFSFPQGYSMGAWIGSVCLPGSL